MMKKILPVILSICLMLTGCDISYVGMGIQDREAALQSPPPAAPAPMATDNYIPRFNSELNLSMRAPKTLNPLVNSDVTVDKVLRLIFEPLCELRENMRPAPNLLSKVEFSSDGMSAACTLREDVYWSDGVKMSSGDVQFSVNAINNDNGSDIYKSIVKDITSVDIIDSSNFRVRFRVAQGGAAYSLCFPVIPRHFYSGEIRESSGTAFTPVGNGVYKLSEIKSIRELTLASNENSFRNKPYIEQVRVFIMDDGETDLQAFDQNIIDAIDSSYMAFGKYSGSKDIITTAYDTNNYVFLGFNFSNAIFSDIMVRQAIAHSIDKDKIMESIYLNNASKADSIINPSSYLYEHELNDYKFDLNEAANLLFQAGCADNDLDGVLDKEIAGFARALKLTLLVNEENAERIKIAQAIKTNLELLNFVVDIEVCDFESYMTRVESGDYDMFLGTLNLDARPDFRFFLHSESVSEGSNYFNYKSDDLDVLIEIAEDARSESELIAAMSAVQGYLAEDLPCISIAFVKRALLSDAGIKGDKKPVIGNIFFNVEEWKIE